MPLFVDAMTGFHVLGVLGVLGVPFVVGVPFVLGTFACSTPQTITATKDPANVTATATPTVAVGAPVGAPHAWRFAFDVSHEISCSQSFETESTYGSYALAITPPHAATLTFESAHTTTFGSNQFDLKAPPPTRNETRTKTEFEGTVARDGDKLSFVFQRKSSECAKTTGPCGEVLAFTCAEASASIVSYDGAGKHLTTKPTFSCHTTYGMPMELDEVGWKGGLVFGDGNGFFLDYVEYGPMQHLPELRVGN